MYKGKTLAAVIPAYNEGTQIHQVVETLPDFVDHIVIIDDKSTDDTVAKVEALQKSDPRVVLLRHEQNQGVGGAMATGYKWARDNGVDMAVRLDGDGQMDHEDLPALCDPVAEDGVDYSKGNRLVDDQVYAVMPKVRFYGNAVLSFLTKIASGYWHISDSQTGYTVISKRALRLIDWDKMYKRYGQPNDLLVRLNVEDMRVRDVPIRPIYNVGEKSNIKIRKVLFTISTLLLRMYIWRLWKKYIVRDAHPLVLFVFLGLLLLSSGTLLSVRFFWLWIQQGNAPMLTFMALLFAFSTGLQATFFGIWMDMDRNRHLR